MKEMQNVCLWQEYHRNNAIFFSSHHVGHNFFICPIICGVHLITRLRWDMKDFSTVNILICPLQLGVCEELL